MKKRSPSFKSFYIIRHHVHPRVKITKKLKRKLQSKSAKFKRKTRFSWKKTEILISARIRAIYRKKLYNSKKDTAQNWAQKSLVPASTNCISNLELRLDVCLIRAIFCSSFRISRFFINTGRVYINRRKNFSSSYIVKIRDFVELKTQSTPWFQSQNFEPINSYILIPSYRMRHRSNIVISYKIQAFILINKPLWTVIPNIIRPKTFIKTNI